MIEKAENYLKKKGVKEYEIFYENSENTKIIIQKERVDFISNGNVDGIGVRVFIDKKLGFSSTLDIKNYEKCIDEAIKIARLNNENKNFKGFNKISRKVNSKSGYDNLLLNSGTEYMNKYFENYMKIVKDIDKEIKLTSGGFNKSIVKKIIINSEGIDLEKLGCSNTFWIELMKSQNNSLGFGEQSKKKLKPEKAKEHVKRLLERERQNTLDTQNINLVLHPEALSELLNESLFYAVDSENVQAKKSILSGKINTKILDKKITITDDSTAKNLICSRPFDDEGVPSMKTTIVNNGVLKSYLYDTYHANIDNVKSTSNAIREYSSTPTISPTNIIMKKENKSEEKILSSVDKCLYVKTLMAAHTMDETTGDFSLGVIEGQIYEKGEMKYSVKDTMIAGNVYKVLNNVISIGNKLIHAGDGNYLPIILTGKVKVIGK